MKAPNSPCLVVKSLEHRVELVDQQKVVKALAQVDQLELTACVSHGGERGHQLADARVVDVGDISHVHKELSVAERHQVLDLLAELGGALAERDLSAGVEHGHIAYLPGIQLQNHWKLASFIHPCLGRG